MHKLPGMDSVPDPFSLLPHFQLKPAFVTYDNESIRTLTLGTAYKKLQTRETVQVLVDRGF